MIDYNKSHPKKLGKDTKIVTISTLTQKEISTELIHLTENVLAVPV